MNTASKAVLHLETSLQIILFKKCKYNTKNVFALKKKDNNVLVLLGNNFIKLLLEPRTRSTNSRDYLFS